MLRALLTGAACATSVVVGELVVRSVDGYRLFAVRLQPVVDHDVTEQLGADDLIAAFTSQPRLLRDDLDPFWLATSPPPVPKHSLPTEMAACYAAGYHAMFLYQWNEVLLRSVWVRGQGPAIGEGLPKPDAFWVFTPADGHPLPRYRFPCGVTLPSGLTLNSFGFRGREIGIDKPKQTVRIACVGASTTVDEHNVPHSYPELLEHFLQEWARQNHRDVAFEVVNAAVEGYLSHETIVNVRHYVLPMAVDYVVYYEGANQLHMPQVMRHVRIDGDVPPKPEFGGIFNPTAAAKGEHKWVYEHSAAMRRLHTVLVRGESISEPPKPLQHIELPAGIADGEIDLARAGELMDLGNILGDLETIRADVGAAGARLVLCSFQWYLHDGLKVDPVKGEHVWRHLNEFYWPVSYASLRRLTDLQNAWFAAWAAKHDADFLDVSSVMPHDARLYTDAIHKTSLGSRCHAWATCALLLPLLERDLARGRLPSPDNEHDAAHPNVGPMRQVTRAELDAAK